MIHTWNGHVAGLYDELVLLARRYWESSAEPPDPEVLLFGEVHVVRAVDENENED